jgi:hypothetical protein
MGRQVVLALHCTTVHACDNTLLALSAPGVECEALSNVLLLGDLAYTDDIVVISFDLDRHFFCRPYKRLNVIVFGIHTIKKSR